ncbi:MoaD/ThiS family protein [Montanilutibacter psychrotolerans]|uniref:Molybdopterin synthase sulfur carrier subunit n=1 Tax=Montanilutibacter psychrotolerans TaxID=1327343 RepID=A0A3M8SVZ1_9GAMM|nr:MoaD/ThiS family protein [Lysobacter psychrotolerans]RNF85459.1 MoaD/ThiS family protein [Lysobacter psychrotolerans]
MSPGALPSGTLTVLYFASLRDAAGCETETVVADAADLRALYLRLQARHGFALPVDRLRVAVDGAFAHWGDVPRAGSEVAFIPPVSGG